MNAWITFKTQNFVPIDFFFFIFLSIPTKSCFKFTFHDTDRHLLFIGQSNGIQCSSIFGDFLYCFHLNLFYFLINSWIGIVDFGLVTARPTDSMAAIWKNSRLICFRPFDFIVLHICRCTNKPQVHICQIKSLNFMVNQEDCHYCITLSLQ